MGLVKNANHFTVRLDKLLNYIPNLKQWDIHILYYDEISSFMEKAYIRSSFMGHGDAETSELIINGDVETSTNELMQVLMGSSNINSKY